MVGSRCRLNGGAMETSKKEDLLSIADEAIDKNKGISQLKRRVRRLYVDNVLVKHHVIQLLKNDERTERRFENLEVRLDKLEERISKNEAKSEIRFERIETQISHLAEGIDWIIQSQKEQKAAIDSLLQSRLRSDAMESILLAHIQDKSIHVQPHVKS